MNSQALLAVTFVSLLSLLGAAFLVVKRTWLTRIMSPLLALSSGVLLGSTFFDLIPESQELVPDQAMVFIIIGIVSFFSLEKLLQWHHHVEGDHPGEGKAVGYLSLIGDGIHNFVDGTIIAAAFLVSTPLGISATLAVIAHEIPHELADFTILLHSGFSNSKALFYNFLSATTAIAGALLVLGVSTTSEVLVLYLVPFAAGNFLYIAMSDLIPELHRRRSRLGSILHIIALIAGISLIYYLPS
ncbi:MAG: hypothetical protein ACD_36C00013G0004 [uncultured bacterium]|uniref:ZIP zinc transporter n=1 Tax=Candidatus Gottesmanbacteria bacterium RIFCSPLOWO2_01_FULL_43_11b TaxID=1798392 RepID=A0A1F6AIE4_9BACT|nr:MAG: hypothetical protein ACD_36C00013G0004 [uncultured bacterium]OGG24386.1 MAG: hypothetical protein A3A79_04345 [Candidatus Gottesmanbacteria bacterium RIFCSPLOWO2_01_FULL_43_11b]